MVYLIHFERPIGSEKKQAQHYLGYAKTLSSRVKRHKEGRGAAILRACNEQKIGWAVVRTWPEGDRALERQLKNRRHHKRLCPVCRAKGDQSVSNCD